MDVRALVISMTVILIILFFLTDRYRKKEVELMKIEVKYYEAIQKWRATQNEETKKEVLEIGKEYGLKFGMLESEVEKMLEKDLKESLPSKL